MHECLHDRPLYFCLCTRATPIATRMAVITSPTKKMTAMAIPAASPSVQGSAKRREGRDTLYCVWMSATVIKIICPVHTKVTVALPWYAASQRALPKTMQTTQTRFEQMPATWYHLFCNPLELKKALLGPKRFAKWSYLPRVLRSRTKELSIYRRGNESLLYHDNLSTLHCQDAVQKVVCRDFKGLSAAQ